MSNGQSVLVVGAGPTGLVIAHELARAGIQCRLIDRDAHRATQSRAIAIHSHTVESFERTETDMGDPPAVAEEC